jgi:segregation and condensation protein B
MEIEKAKAALEAVLFTMGDSVELRTLAHAAELDEETARKLILSLKEDYEREERGIQIVQLEDCFQMCTRAEYYEALIRVATQPKKHHLSEALLETLSIVAYKQPITRLEIEKIRGVSCAHAVDRLVEYGLIEETGRLNAPGRPILFGTTEEFLRCFGLPSLEELPVLETEKIETLKEEAEEEAQLTLRLDT